MRSNKQGESWGAGLLEHRIALGIALTATLALLVLLVLGPAEVPTDKGVSRAVSTASTSVQDRKFSIPERSANQAPSAPTSPDAASRTHPATAAHPQPTTSKPETRKPTPVARSKPRPVPKAPARSAPSKATTDPVASMPGKVFFVQVGAYRERRSAQQQAAMLLQKGWNSIVSTNAGGLYVVRIGPSSSRKEANKLRDTLLNKAGLKGFVVEG